MKTAWTGTVPTLLHEELGRPRDDDGTAEAMNRGSGAWSPRRLIGVETPTFRPCGSFLTGLFLRPMRTKTLLFTSLVAWGLLVGGCALLKEGTMLENERDLDAPPDRFGSGVDPSEVHVYDDTSAIGCRWEHVALIRLPASTEETKSDDRTRRAKRRAAKVEANGIVLAYDPSEYGPYSREPVRQDRVLAIEEERPCP